MSIRIIWARLHSDSELLHLMHCHALISQQTSNSMHEIRQIYINQSRLKKGALTACASFHVSALYIFLITIGWVCILYEL